MISCFQSEYLILGTDGTSRSVWHLDVGGGSFRPFGSSSGASTDRSCSGSSRDPSGAFCSRSDRDQGAWRPVCHRGVCLFCTSVYMGGTCGSKLHINTNRALHCSKMINVVVAVALCLSCLNVAGEDPTCSLLC